MGDVRCPPGPEQLGYPPSIHQNCQIEDERERGEALGKGQIIMYLKEGSEAEAPAGLRKQQHGVCVTVHGQRNCDDRKSATHEKCGTVA